MRRTLSILTFFLISVTLATGQEVLTGLSENSRVKEAAREYKPSQKLRASGMLELPFIDDFSNAGVFPVDTLWQDRNVFINNAYGYKPFTIGVATFDALNDTGSIYSNAVPSKFPADTLTSHEIRLDSVTSLNKKLSPADSVYLSFYIQPQGVGNTPEEDDSLSLRFYAPLQQRWVHVWSTTGTDLQTFFDTNGVYMKRIMVPVTDSIFFHKGFKMRFMNYASISNNSIPSWVAGNVDIWNLDYVYLDMQRSHNDTSLVDWALTSETGSLLRNYVQMPWNQYKVAPTAEMADTFRINYRSNKGKRDVNMTFRITDLSGQSQPFNTFPTPITNQKMPSFSEYEFEYVLDYNYPPNNLTYNDFEVLFYINVPDDPHNFNDTSRFYQRFYNWYAYDDGTSEAGYGIASNLGQVAYQFTLNEPDTLQSIQMYFNRVKNNANIKSFSLAVWDDDGGEPGNVIYSQSGHFPQFNGSNEYHTYVLDQPVAVSGTFYIGWQQTTADNLNVGFDLNNNEQSKIFYYTFSNWNNTIHEGALMMRPILGSDLYPHVGAEEMVAGKPDITVYPNPVSAGSTLTIETGIMQKDLLCKLYSIEGREIKTYIAQKNLHIPELENGLYILRIQNSSTGAASVKKIMIIR